MNKEPVALYVFRFALGLGLFGFMAMLYWSSVLLEDELQEVKEEVRELQNSLYEVVNETQKLNSDVLEAIVEDQRSRQKLLENVLKNSSDRAFVRSEAKEQQATTSETDESEPEYPNLLNKDPFYEKKLPEMLGRGFRPQGIRRSATIGKPDHLHPLSNWSSVSSWLNMCNVSVAKLEFGKFETMAPNAAVRLEAHPVAEGKGLEFLVYLRDDLYWEPLNPDHFPEDVELAPVFSRRHQVTAHDFKFYFDVVMNPHVQEAGAASLRNYLGDIEEFRVIDDFTFAVRWKSEKTNGDEKVKYAAKSLTGSLEPLARFVFQYYPDGSKIVEDDKAADTYRVNSVWAQNFGQHWARNVIVSCGPWLFDGMSDRMIRFKRNPQFYNPLAVLVKAHEISFRDSPEAIWQDFKSGQIDTYSIRPEQLVELENFLQSDDYQQQISEGLKIHRVDYVARSYSYVGWNQANSLFSSQKVRRAMTMAIDRERIIRQNLNRFGIPITGPFFQNSPSYDTSIVPLAFDLQTARQLLEEDGWFDSDGDGVRDKEINGNRIPFRFGLTYYVKNPTSKANADTIATQLRDIGVDCQLNGVDIADLSSIWDEKGFDAIYLGWALGSPPEEPKQLWHSSGAKEKGSSNAVGFQNLEADRIIAELQYEYDKQKRIELYHRFHRIIHDEAPYTFLYTPKSIMLYRDYVQNVFIPANRQDLVPGANVAQPDSSVFYLRNVEKQNR